MVFETRMDLITQALVDEFCTEHGLSSLPEDKRFEHFASWITVRRHYSETFDTGDVVTGSGSDTGIDAIAIIVNGSLIAEIDEFKALEAQSGHLDVTFVFVQARRSSSFDGSAIANFAFGVADFFAPRPKLKRSEEIKEAAATMAAIYKKSSKFRRGKPACRLYFVTTGKWTGEPDLEARRSTAKSDIEALNLFDLVEVVPIGAPTIHTLYQQAKNTISREFGFPNATVVPEVAGVSVAYLGLVSAREFLSIIEDEEGSIIKGIFYDNVRDWQDFNTVNSEMAATLDSEMKARFSLMNNGVTIIARHLQPTGNRFLIEDFQIANGCQTSHVLHNKREKLDDSVMIPLRLIATQDEEVISSIIRATNRQTQIREEQFFAITEFAKSLETYLQAFPNGHKLFYERRSRQYDKLSIEKTRIVTHVNLVRTFGAMFLEEPHSTTRRYKSLAVKVGKDIFVEGHRLEPYYVAAFALYKLEYLFRNQKIEAKYKSARYQILFAARLLADPGPLPKMNSHEMARRCDAIKEILWDPQKADDLFTRATTAVEAVAKGNLKKDAVRTQPFTVAVRTYCAPS